MAGMPGIVIRVAADTRDAIQGLRHVDKALARTSGNWKRAGVAVGAAATAAAAGVAAFSADAVGAFLDEEKGVESFRQTLANLDLAGQTKQVEDWIDALQYSANVADDELRPAYARILRSTEDVTETQRALKIALDISAATGNDLATVANALGKAYDGNGASLGRLGLGLDKALLKSGDMVKITEELIAKFGGQAEAREHTLSGAIEGVSNAWDEWKQSWGEGLATGSGGTDEAIKNLETLEKTLQYTKEDIKDSGASIHDLFTTATLGATALGHAQDALLDRNFADAWASLFPKSEDEWLNAQERITGIARHFEIAAGAMATYVQGLENVKAANSDFANSPDPTAGMDEDFVPLSERLRIMRLQHKYAGVRAENAKRRAAAAKLKADRAAAAKKARADALAARRASARLGRSVNGGHGVPGTVCA